MPILGQLRRIDPFFQRPYSFWDLGHRLKRLRFVKKGVAIRRIRRQTPIVEFHGRGVVPKLGMLLGQPIEHKRITRIRGQELLKVGDRRH